MNKKDTDNIISALNDAPSHSDRVKMINISANVAGIGLSEESSDLIVSLYEAILEKRDSLTIKEIYTIKHEVKCRADAKARSEMLDKVSKKI